MPLPTSFEQALPSVAAVRDANPPRKKALVVLFLGGGADGHNTIIPRTGANRANYEAARPNARIPLGSELALSADWGLHPNLPALKAQWDAGKLAVVANCGPLVVPVTKLQVESRSAPLPADLFSHSDQSAQWQEGRAGEGFASTTGWLGRAFDLLAPTYNTPGPLAKLAFGFSPSAALDAHEATQFALNQNTGPVTRTLAGTTNGVSAPFDAINDAIAAQLGHPIARDFADISTAGNANALALKTAFDATTVPTPTPAFLSTGIAQQLRTIVRMVAAQGLGQQPGIGHERSAFFAVMGGYDQHADLVNTLAAQYTTLNAALASYFAALVQLGIADRVVTLIYSEFGRTFTQNATGTDHAWGTHAFVVGQDVTGGFYGTLPSLSLTGPDMYDARGFLIPTTSFEQIYAPLLRWMGIPASAMPLVMPNAGNFNLNSLAGMVPAMAG